TLMPGGNPAFGGDTNTSNTADTAPNCQPGTATDVPNVNNTGVLPLDMLNNRYLNLQQCVYTSTENFTTLMPGGNPAYGGNTNASDTADTAPDCQPGTATVVPNVNNTRVLPLDTLDTTRGAGYVQFAMYVPDVTSTTTFPQDATLNGFGTGTPSSSATVTVDPALAIPMFSGQALAGAATLCGLAGIAWRTYRRRTVAQ
ncbi:hypothetical protein OV450_8444, partial [Actinobacteria bacterium OV450]